MWDKYFKVVFFLWEDNYILVIEVDWLGLILVILNFLENVVKYIFDFLKIEVVFDWVEDIVSLVVVDNGIGILDKDKW